jgi:hypothetical protein
MTRRSLRFPALAVAALAAVVSVGAATGGRSSIRSEDLREWLSYIASDELEGRAVYSAGLGLAAAYIQNHLRAWGATPAGDDRSYLQTVRVLGVKSNNHSTLTVEVDGRRRTFTNGQGITFRRNVGGKRQFTVDRVEFVGYGLDAPRSHHEDFTGRDVKGTAVVWLGPRGPKGLDQPPADGALAGRSRYVIQQLNAVASIGPASIAGPADRVAAGPADQGSGGTAPDFTTVQRLDQPIAPIATAGDAFFEFLFSHAPTKYDELKRKADARDPLPGFRLAGVTLTFTLDAEYQVVRTQLSQNVVAVVEGTDPRLKNTYVAFGAHYDHLGYAEGEVVNGQNGPIRLGAPGRVQDGAIDDRIWNGADDDGSGTVALLALAQALRTAHGRSARCSSCGIRARNADCGAHATSWITRPSLSIASSPS